MTGSVIDQHADYDRKKLFLLSCIALASTGIAFGIRSFINPDLQKTFFDPFHADTATKLVGGVVGAVSLGFVISILIGSPLCDYLGMGRLLGIFVALFSIGSIGVILAPPSANVYVILFTLFFVVGLGQGMVEATINPLIATLYPDDKTHRLNVLHAWWPGGIIIGTLLGLGLAEVHLGWKVQLLVSLGPVAITAILLIGTRFPPTERVAAAVTAREMGKEAVRPLFILLFFCMMLTAASELAPGQWVQSMLTRLVHFQGILLLTYVSALMFVMRHFAGSFAHRLSPVGLMFVSCLLASIGLFMLGNASSPVTGLVAATVWGVGVCYMWPTMLGITSERFPKGGALLMGLMGGSGNISVYYSLPFLGGVFDRAKLSAAQAAGTSFDAIKNLPETDPTMNHVLSTASTTAFHTVAILPAVLIFVFGAWWLIDKARGGYRAVKLQPVTEAAVGSAEKRTPTA